VNANSVYSYQISADKNKKGCDFYAEKKLPKTGDFKM
jgi:hypothetical protein